MDQVMAKLFHRVRQLSTLANLMVDGPGHDPELQQQYTRGLLLLERQVNASIWSLNVNNLRQRGSATRPRGPIAVRTCARTWHCTTLMYIYMVLKQNPPRSKIVEKLVSRHKYSLQILTPEELWIHFPPHFLLWSLVIANIASAGHPDRWWLLQLLKTLQTKLALDWEAAKIILGHFAWVDRICTKPSRLIWEELDTVEL
jgi:Fungal specific transcription factor domain